MAAQRVTENRKAELEKIEQRAIEDKKAALIIRLKELDVIDRANINSASMFRTPRFQNREPSRAQNETFK